MDQYLQKKPLSVPLDQLWPDPNNPRLALTEAPGYDDPDQLFDQGVRAKIFADLGDQAYGVDDLVDAIVGQGWMPIDNMIVWKHPADGGRYVVVEGNRRRLALERIRTSRLPKEQRKLARMHAKASTFAKYQIEGQERLVERVEGVLADTEQLTVVPIAADTVEELLNKLPRILAVRHITGAKEWSNYAEHLYLLQRYEHLFEESHPGRNPFWDDTLIEQVANEASLGRTNAKRRIKSASWFGHFRAEWEDELPDGEEFAGSDYYLFEQIAGKPAIRQKLGVGDDSMQLPNEAESALFEWVFKLPRTGNADTNPNKFFRHENITLWDQMARYDQKSNTSFAAFFDISNPETAPRMHELHAAYLTHKAQRAPHAVIDDLLQRLSELTAVQLANEGQILRVQLERLRDQAEKFLKMIDATAG